MGFDSENIFNNDKKLYKSDIFNNLINNTITYIIDQKDNNNFNYLVNHSKQDIKIFIKQRPIGEIKIYKQYYQQLWYYYQGVQGRYR